MKNACPENNHVPIYFLKIDFAPELFGNFVASPSLHSGLLTAVMREYKKFIGGTRWHQKC
jgi:hypothetical protein